MPGPSDQIVAAAQALSLAFSAAFLAYWCCILSAYLRRRPEEPGDAEAFAWHLFVPCRDEAAVIGGTLTYLRATFPKAEVWVIDDDSDDATASIARSFVDRDDAVHLVQRRRPEARTGKGDALNDAYRALRARLGGQADLSRVIVGVVDADGRPSANCLGACAGARFFGDAKVGGVQVEVRIMNRTDDRPLPGRGRAANFFGRTLVRMQDVEFRTVIGAIQTSRRRTHTVGMGGNGQFTRLSALAALDEGDGRAWRGSLLEDFELGLHLLLAGYDNAFSADAWVDQEGLPSFDRYLTQRTRWGQGVMQCGRYLPDAWNSPKLTTLGALEVSYYLLQPWLTLLGTIVFPLPLIALAAGNARAGVGMGEFLASGGWALIAMYLVLGTAPFIMWGPLYRRRCEPQATRRAALGWGFAYLLYVYGFYVTSWRAFVRIVRGQHSWSKTRRNAEFDQPSPEAADGRRLPVMATEGTVGLVPAASLARPRRCVAAARATTQLPMPSPGCPRRLPATAAAPPVPPCRAGRPLRCPRSRLERARPPPGGRNRNDAVLNPIHHARPAVGGSPTPTAGWRVGGNQCPSLRSAIVPSGRNRP